MTIEPERSDRTVEADRHIHPWMRRFLVFERGAQPMLTRPEFARRMASNSLASFSIIGLSLLIGVLGYYVTSDPPHRTWLDALYRASMILTGMGPVDPLRGPAA